MRYVTDYSSNTFALYVGTIYISTISFLSTKGPSNPNSQLVKGVEELSINFYDDRIANGFVSVMIGILFTLTVYFLEKIRSTTLFTEGIREVLSDYAYPVRFCYLNAFQQANKFFKLATIWWTGFSHIPGNLRHVHIEALPITRSWYPTVPRPYVWLVEFWHLPVKWVFVALPIGMLVTLLFYYDHVS